MIVPLLFMILISVERSISLESQCCRKGGSRQTKIMKLKPRSQSSSQTQFIKTSYSAGKIPSPSPTFVGQEYLFERLEPLSNKMSIGREIEQIILETSNKKLANLGITTFDRCIMIGVEPQTMSHNLLDSFKELSDLSAYTSLQILGCESQKSGNITNDQIFGIGKIKQIATQMVTSFSDTVIFDGELSPIQLRNLEDSIRNELPKGLRLIKVLDKTSIILDIIAQNSKTAEGSLQGELAILLYRLPRMTAMWKILAKPIEKSLSVGYRGPGGKRIDLDFKMMRKRIRFLTKTIKDVRALRSLQRTNRNNLPTVAIVGYAQSGKTSIHDALSNHEYSSFQDNEQSSSPFKTLEGITRRIKVPKQEKLSNCNSNLKSLRLSVSRSICPDFLLSDNLSFINDLPQCVIQAFQMTFDELRASDIIVNVCDISHPNWQAHEKSVLTTLNKIEGLCDKPIITVWNKLDKFPEEDISFIEQEAMKRHQTVALSSATGAGFQHLLGIFHNVMKNTLMVEVNGTLSYSPTNLALLSKFHQNSSLKIVEYTAEGIFVEGKIPLSLCNQFKDSIIKKEENIKNYVMAYTL